MLILVTGLGRSGTSLMMQTLDLGGIKTLRDLDFEKHLDQKFPNGNTTGWYEHSNPRLAADEWLNSASSDDFAAIKTVQVPAMMQPVVESNRVILIIMERNPEAQAKSWRKQFTGEPPLDRQEQIDKLKEAAAITLQIPYNGLVDEPEKWLAKVAKFIPLDIDKACAAVKPELRHYK